MAFSNFESSRDRQQPVMLFRFIYGVEVDGTTPIAFDHTDGESEVVHDTITYTPLSIKMGRIEATGKMDSRDVTITVPRNSDVADLFRIFPPSRVVTVEIRQGHIPNPDDPVDFSVGEQFPIIWLGRVLESSRDGPEARLTCEAASASMKRSGLRRHYQWACPLVLYGSRCSANKVNATTTATVASISGNRVTLSGTWQKQIEDPPPDPLPDPYTPTFSDVGASNYTGGLLEWTGTRGPEQRTIMRVEGTDTLVLSGPPLDLAAPDPVNIVLGCPHTLTSCETLHDNVLNYGGHPFIPTYNPVNKNNHT